MLKPAANLQFGMKHVSVMTKLSSKVSPKYSGEIAISGRPQHKIRSPNSVTVACSGDRGTMAKPLAVMRETAPCPPNQKKNKTKTKTKTQKKVNSSKGCERDLDWVPTLKTVLKSKTKRHFPRPARLPLLGTKSAKSQEWDLHPQLSALSGLAAVELVARQRPLMVCSHSEVAARKFRKEVF
jgi:hypothetical protein